MAAAGNALIGVDYYRSFAGVSEDSTSFPDQAIEILINQASQTIESECNRKFITPSSAITEIFDGTGTRDYYVNQGRISETPTIKYWQSTAFTSTTYTVAYDSDSGRVYFNDGNVFNRGRDNWQITYKYGWTQATLPADIKLACVALVSHLRQVRMKLGISSESFGDTSVSYDWTAIDSFTQNLKNNYKVMSYG